MAMTRYFSIKEKITISFSIFCFYFLNSFKNYKFSGKVREMPKIKFWVWDILIVIHVQ
jgi:hypothetical protein